MGREEKHGREEKTGAAGTGRYYSEDAEPKTYWPMRWNTAAGMAETGGRGGRGNAALRLLPIKLLPLRKR